MFDPTCGTTHARWQSCPPSSAFTQLCRDCGQYHLASEYRPCECGKHGPNLYSCPPCVSAAPQTFAIPAWVARNIRKDQPLVAVKELSRV